MRSDMTKVIHEAYRYGRGLGDKPGRAPRDPEDRPSHESIRHPFLLGARGRRMKESGSHHQPFRRYLHKQVGRRWDEVFSEICRTADHRTPAHRRMMEWVDCWVVTKNLLEKDGKVLVSSPYSPPTPVSGLFVHPRTGVLTMGQGLTWKAKQRERVAEQRAERAKSVREISPTEKLVRVDGVWYLVQYAPVSAPREIVAYQYIDIKGQRCERLRIDEESVCRDVLTGIAYYMAPRAPAMYAKSKRQAPSKLLRQHGLTG